MDVRNDLELRRGGTLVGHDHGCCGNGNTADVEISMACRQVNYGDGSESFDDLIVASNSGRRF